MVGLAAAPAEARGKRYRHALGFQLELPDKWIAEPAASGATLEPPDAKVDPQREDNPEVYWVWAPEAEGGSEQEYVKTIRSNFKEAGIEVERGGDLEGFSTPGHPGVIYTFDFEHPKDGKQYRMRIYAMQHNG
jgi:hypothetical protein